MNTETSPFITGLLLAHGIDPAAEVLDPKRTAKRAVDAELAHLKQREQAVHDWITAIHHEAGCTEDSDCDLFDLPLPS